MDKDEALRVISDVGLILFGLRPMLEGHPNHARLGEIMGKLGDVGRWIKTEREQEERGQDK